MEAIRGARQGNPGLDEIEGLGGNAHNYDPNREVYAWRHDVRGSPSPTLRISRQDYPAFAVLYHLDQLKVAQAIRADPAARLVVLPDRTSPQWI